MSNCDVDLTESWARIIMKDDDPVWPDPGGAPTGYYLALGRLTSDWARIEDCIDCACGIARNAFGGSAALPRDGVPRSLDRKASYLRKAFKTLPRLQPWRAEANKLLDAVHELKDQRHKLIHGVQFAVNDEGMVQMGRWKHEPDWLRTERYSFDEASITKLRHQMKPVMIRWVKLARLLCYEMHPRFFDEIAGEPLQLPARNVTVIQRLVAIGAKSLTLLRRV